MVRLSYDLHIHSCLSPCGDDDMLPSNIVGMAALKELDVIAVTDHNSCLNCPAVMKLAEAYGVTAIPGMELTTAEEVHVVCLFPTLEKALEFGEYVYSKLLPFPNDEAVFGKQQIVDEDDNVVGKVENLLINATDIYFYELYDLLKEYDGLMIPAHVDKSANSLLSNLGFIPPDSRFKTAEIKHIGFMEDILEKNPYLKDCVIISDSDAHYLENINEPINFIEAESKSIADVFKALRGKE